MHVRNTGRRPACAGARFATLAASPASAEETPKALAPIEVRETAPSQTLDTPRRKSRRASTSPRAKRRPRSATLDAAQLQERGARTSIEAINAAPGVLVANLASSPGMTAMRGFAGGAISLLYDGMRQTAGPLVTAI